ncbi:zinc-dependent alcohol dehydrogenase family protein [Aspergillus affinis]|uniref:zinc-dependent alcohol dehydrogenase family protein n=1 Tax=Aspergillus affinis TaxID=1070780 RepID=UPI0022FF414D|nr:GroES-like protein [Aspergillus affinis]KAI9038222.1 GroES-like protein [Aspergillus affinis]
MASSSKAWILTGQEGPQSLKFVENQELPPLGDHDVRVKIQAASLNYRDIAIAKGTYGLTIEPNVVPGSDGAGVVEAVGSSVNKFQPGDHVCTHMTSGMTENAPATFADIGGGLGQRIDGTLRTHGVFHDTSLVKMPRNLSFDEAATLTCSALTAWNGLFGIEGREPKKGHVVLVQGTGGVSIAALQFALAAGATVTATTSSDEKAARLRSLGAQHVINYKITPNWGEEAKRVTPDGKGVHTVIDVGGLSTLRQSLHAVRPEGMIALTGLLGQAPDGDIPNIMDGLLHLCTTRGLLLGTRAQFEAMNQFLEEKNVKPVLDDKVFPLQETKEAFEYMSQQHHFSKIVIHIS